MFPRTPPFNRRLALAARRAADVRRGPDGAARAAQPPPARCASLKPTLTYLAPDADPRATTSTLWFRNVSSLLSEGDAQGTWQRFIIVATPQGPNNEGGPSSAPADGPTRENHLHTNPYPNTAAPGQPKECEAGNEPYVAGRTIIGNSAGTQQARTEGDALMRRRTPRSPVAVGLIALAVAVAIVFFGFTKDIPFTTPFQVRATFESANSIRPNSPVRIAGVQVGKVKSVEAEEGTDAAVVVLEINDQGLPLHTDATAKIRPRIFLEGNFFVDLKPGSPEAPELEDGGTLKVTQTATPVQLDEVLTALQSDSRQDLKDLLDGLAVALTSEPTAAEDRDSDPLGARRDGGEVVQRRLRRHPGRRALDRAGARRRCWASSPAATSRG